MKQILIITNSSELSTNDVLDELNRMGVPWTRLNGDRLQSEIHCSWKMTDDDSDPKVQIECLDQIIFPSTVSSVWFRRDPRPSALASLSYHEDVFIRREISNFWPALYRSLNDKTWINPWEASTITKPDQLHAASRVGLSVPCTLVSNDPVAVRNFIGEFGPKVIAKPLSHGLVGNLRDFDLRQDGTRINDIPYFCYTQCIGLDDITDNFSVTACPVIYQELVPKDRELRVTVVGDRFYSVAMLTNESQKAEVDWRRLGMKIADITHIVHPLPIDIEQCVQKFMQEVGLVFGCIDMILTPGGEYIFLEVNPFGQWGWVETMTGLPISRSIAELLSSYSTL